MKRTATILAVALALFSVCSRGARAASTSCNTCADCNAKLSGSYDLVTLSADILDHPGGCISVTGANLTFDCGAHTLRGTDDGIGIFNDGQAGVTIQNCKITRFDIGIGVNNVSSSTLAANEITQCGRGILLAGATCTLSTNVVRYSAYEGIVLVGSSGNQLNSNESCANVEYDIVTTGGSGNTGTGNRCDDVSGWNDTGETGCSLSCAVCDDFDVDGVCDASDNCPFDPNPGQQDADSDGVGDVCDNCPSVANSDQANSDLFDEFGDACDTCWFNQYSPQSDQDGDCALLKTDSSFWDGMRWLKDPHCGDLCDNCMTQSNPYQEDADGDDRGNICDNCPNTSNSSQDDYDGDGHGDECDNCWLRPNADQSNQDGDVLGDVCDNCRTVANDDQNDQDHDCIVTPPYSTDPHCGDACDNCPSHRNTNQEDWDADGQGDACDCNDKLMGENEEGADCGGLCPATCPTGCVPIFQHGDPKGKLDVVFIPTLEYSSLDEFRDDVRENPVFGALLAAPTLSTNKTKMNFWYTKKIAPFTNPGGNNACQWSEPNNWKADCPHADVGVIVHKYKCRDSSVGGVFSAQSECRRTFVHEIGHSAFGLQDEYNDCSTNYQKCPGKYCNIYESLAACQAASLDPSGCQQFTTCDGGWWTSQPGYTMMAQYCAFLESCSLCTWGADGQRVVQEELKPYVDPPGDDYRKALVGYFHYDGASITLNEVDVVYGEAPDRFLDWGVLGFRFRDSAGNEANAYTTADPRYVDYVDPVGGEMLPAVDFSSVFPFFDNLKTLEIRDVESETILGSFDLSPALHRFCGEHPEDPQCESYDSDGDGLPDPEDECVESIREETITIGDCDTGVANQELHHGCTMSDRIAECAENARRHGGFVRCVAGLAYRWRRAGLIGAGEPGRIVSCAGTFRFFLQSF